VVENRVPRRILGPKRKDGQKAGGCCITGNIITWDGWNMQHEWGR